MKTLRKDKKCYAQVGDDWCNEDAEFGTIYCEKHCQDFEIEK